ncbi:ubiquitin-protein ligase E3C [Anabrus simplex]|uniref:ubiquitin-protein ligase E3C n=1 Tax=Anabrus simplex TaxID=316456 RepID=UPI0035A2BEBC
MYSFEGQFRRKPEQNLAGASKKQEREELLQKVQHERHKREVFRKQHHSTILIQSYVRSFLTRQHHKRLQRALFDETVQQAASQILDEDALAVLIRRLLFFYDEQIDSSRLVWLSQLLLRQHEKILHATVHSMWSWRLRCMLHLNVEHVVAIIRSSSRDALAVSLRTIEVFTSWEMSKNVLGEAKALMHLTGVFTYLIRRHYFQHIRYILDQKTPPMLEASSNPPTPLTGYVFEMITRPLHLVSNTSNNEFSNLVLQGLCEHILAPPLTEPVQLFIIPALVEFPHFPFHRLIQALRDCKGFAERTSTIVPSIWLLFSVLALEKKHFALVQPNDTILLLNYLQILAILSVNIAHVYGTLNNLKDSGSDDDNDSEMGEGAKESEDTRVLEQCIEMLNDTSRVQNLLSAVDQSEDPLVLQALCQVCHNLLISHKSAIHKYRLLYMLAFKPTFLRHLWTAILSVSQTSLFGSATPLLQVIARGIPMIPADSERIVPLLAVFCSLFSLLIVTLHDAEFYADETLPGATMQTMPFALSDLVPLSLTLKEVCLGLVELAFPDSRPSVRDDYRAAVHGRDLPPAVNPQETQMWAHLFKVTVGLVRQLHSRDIRRPFCPEGHWISKQVVIPLDKPSDFSLRRHRLRIYRPFQGLRVFTKEELEEGPPLSTKEVRTITILRELPFVVPFQKRVLVFQSLVIKDKMEHQGEHSHFLQGPSIQIIVRRNYLYEDAFDKLSLDNEPELRLKMRVQLVNVAGVDEAGVDGGGVFREFLSELLKTAFDPNRGFFRITKDNLLYPNPNVHLLVEDFPRHYFFIGRILGKALYENLLVELRFAEFFLSKLVHHHSDVDVHHLDSLDPVMYRNLLYLKSYEGDVAELGLDFTVVNDELGETRVDELKPGGANIPVTAHNRIEYIHLMADYKLNRQIRAQCNAFKQGLANVVPLEWLQMFNNKELQVLISGAEIPVDVEDLKQHTSYTGGYAPDHPTVKVFWKVVENFTDIQRRQLLKFVTSCSRPPLLGFKELDPPFCIQHAGTINRLPTASTCMNLLKLPEFPDEVTLRDKLLYAIQAGAGFELS